MSSSRKLGFLKERACLKRPSPPRAAASPAWPQWPTGSGRPLGAADERREVSLFAVARIWVVGLWASGILAEGLG